MASMKNISSMSDYEDALAAAGDELIVVEFWSDDVPVIESLLNSGEDTYTDVSFMSININAAGDVASTLSVDSTPTLLLMKNGSEITRESGSYDSDVVKKLLADNGH